MDAPENFTVYNELKSVYDFYRLFETEQLNVTPEFRKGKTWSNAKKTKFIDSLFNRLPIPITCLAHDYKQEQFLIVDGVQRINTIIDLLSSNTEFKLSKLKDIDKKLSGKSALALQKQQDLISRIENLPIPNTVIRCDLSKEADRERVLMASQRLNINK